MSLARNLWLLGCSLEEKDENNQGEISRDHESLREERVVEEEEEEEECQVIDRV